MSMGGRTISRRRLILVDGLIGFTTLLGVLAMFAIWANRQLLNPDNWANTSTQLLQNAAIRDATANYVVDQLYANVDVPGLIGSALPARLKPLARPASGALRNAAVQGATLALSRPRVQSLWATANRAADQTLVTIFNVGKGAVRINGGVVTLNLASIVDDIAARLGLPSGVGAKLPASIANLQVLKSNQIKLVQDIGSALKGLALWLTIIVPLLYALAIALARGRRRRTLMSVGFAILIAGVLVLLGRSLLESQVPASLVKDASILPAATAVVSIGTSMLSQLAGAFLIVGAVLVVAAWFAGGARPAVAVRRAIAPFLPQIEHLAALRDSGVITPEDYDAAKAQLFVKTTRWLEQMKQPWPIRSVIAGTAGTAAMTFTYAAERRLRPKARGPLDYDDSLVPGQIVAGIMHLPHVTDREENELGLMLRWSYGSMFGLWHGFLRRRIPEPWASVAFGGTLMTATLTLFPALGRTPLPWRWSPRFIATSFATHAAYVAAVAAVDDRVRPG